MNYRREDSQSITGRIDDYLRAAFGDVDVYRDIDSIPPGADFVEHLQNALQRCDVCVAILGLKWTSDRLQDNRDFVRMELESALSKDIPVIPVLVEGAQLPEREQIPGSLHALLRRQALRIDSGSDFRVHVQRLVDSIRRVREDRAKVETRRAADAQAEVEAKGAAGVRAETEANRAAKAQASRFDIRLRSVRIVGAFIAFFGLGWLGLNRMFADSSAVNAHPLAFQPTLSSAPTGEGLVPVATPSSLGPEPATSVGSHPAEMSDAPPASEPEPTRAELQRQRWLEGNVAFSVDISASRPCSVKILSREGTYRFSCLDWQCSLIFNIAGDPGEVACSGTFAPSRARLSCLDIKQGRVCGATYRYRDESRTLAIQLVE